MAHLTIELGSSKKKPKNDSRQDAISLTKFQPLDHIKSPSSLQLPAEQWTTVLGTPCTFPPEIFQEVMLNLIKNPNITSSHLFRADIFYDSGDNHNHVESGKSDLEKHLKAEYRPRDFQVPDYERTRTIVRQLVPRNPQVDQPLVQTCHLFQRLQEDEEDAIVLYIPHIEREEDMPFYHPSVAKLAFHHTWRHPCSEGDPTTQAPGSLTVSYKLFPNADLTQKLTRTALRLLQTVHKHGQGLLAGYEKRVHHDRIIAQKRYQDTYARLKTRYGKQLTEAWVEVTDPGKHVFEDIGIAAFLIELWRDMYAAASLPDGDTQNVKVSGVDTTEHKPLFPGFVDIGCGNGLLVYILLSEGYAGWGFDARQRKTWTIFSPQIQSHLEQRLLIPQVFLSTLLAGGKEEEVYHNGIFAPGTFIISNHADELTPWTPLLAYLNDSAFIAIPCCSHDLSGARFRAPPTTKAYRQRVRLPQQESAATLASSTSLAAPNTNQAPSTFGAAETGSLERTEAQKKMPSAYATLCSYVASLAEEVGFVPETELLRIPSTRNHCIVGRRRREQPEREEEKAGSATKQAVVTSVVERELNGKEVEVVGGEWNERAEKLAKKPGSGH